jgi:hypothetical protein
VWRRSRGHKTHIRSSQCGRPALPLNLLAYRKRDVILAASGESGALKLHESWCFISPNRPVTQAWDYIEVGMVPKMNCDVFAVGYVGTDKK